jgi:hypothetical protein
MVDPSGEQPLEAASETTYAGHRPVPLALRPSNATRSIAPEHFPTLSLEVGRAYLHVAAGAILKKRAPQKKRKCKEQVFGTAAGFAIPTMAASEADCKARWDKADVSKSGTLEGKAATAYLDAITKSGKKHDIWVRKTRCGGRPSW